VFGSREVVLPVLLLVPVGEHAGEQEPEHTLHEPGPLYHVEDQQVEAPVGLHVQVLEEGVAAAALDVHAQELHGHAEPEDQRQE